MLWKTKSMLLFCFAAGTFAHLKSKRPLIKPFKLMHSVIQSLAINRIGFIAPFAEQEAPIQARWTAVGLETAVWTANPRPTRYPICSTATRRNQQKQTASHHPRLRRTSADTSAAIPTGQPHPRLRHRTSGNSHIGEYTWGIVGQHFGWSGCSRKGGVC